MIIPSRRIFPLLLTLVLAAATPQSLRAAIVSIYWEGTISNIVSFAPDSVPVGLTVGTPISGSAIFDASQSSRQQFILGSHQSGKTYRFAEPLTQTMNAAGLEWRVSGGDVSLLTYAYEPKEAVDVYSTSSFSLAESFPNQVGPFELGFALFDESLALFDDIELESTTLTLSKTTFGSGSLTSRHWDDTGEIVEGYYITFNISRASPTPVPEPSSLGLIAIGSAVGLIAWRRRPKCA